MCMHDKLFYIFFKNTESAHMIIKFKLTNNQMNPGDIPLNIPK